MNKYKSGPRILLYFTGFFQRTGGISELNGR
jgi:hypothetical protein